jgi:hypothetical protein
MSVVRARWSRPLTRSRREREDSILDVTAAGLKRVWTEIQLPLEFNDRLLWTRKLTFQCLKSEVFVVIWRAVGLKTNTYLRVKRPWRRKEDNITRGTVWSTQFQKVLITPQHGRWRQQFTFLMTPAQRHGGFRSLLPWKELYSSYVIVVGFPFKWYTLN